jgi:hypothetical protein
MAIPLFLLIDTFLRFAGNLLKGRQSLALFKTGF